MINKYFSMTNSAYKKRIDFFKSQRDKQLTQYRCPTNYVELTHENRRQKSCGMLPNKPKYSHSQLVTSKRVFRLYNKCNAEKNKVNAINKSSHK